MNLSDAQKQQVRQWITEGAKLSEIQNRLSKEFGISVTYMEVRFLVDDLKVMPKDVEPMEPIKPLDPQKNSTPPEDDDQLAESEAAPPEIPAAMPGTGKVSLGVDEIAVPGTVVSGKVTFSDGQSGQWYLDEMGRLGLAMKQKGYRPPQSDVQAFQAALQKELAKMGF